MATELINPNLHVALIHYPLALLIVGTLIELFSFLWRYSGFRTAGRWMILIGALSAIPATFSGMYALADIAQRNNPIGSGPWVDVKAASPLLSQPAVWHLLRDHALYQSIATGICALVVIFWLACSDRARRSLHIPLLIVLLFGVSIIVRGASHGGAAVFEHAVGVQTGGVQTSQSVESPAANEAQAIPAFERYVPPEELHVFLAGIAIALALVSIGLSIRKITATVEVNETQRIAPQPQAMAVMGSGASPTSFAMARSFNPDIEVTMRPFAPAARFWLLTFVVALLTLAAGWFIIAADAGALTQAKHAHQPVAKVLWNELWGEIKPDHGKINRALAHVMSGAVIVIMPLVLAALARFAPRRRFWLALCSFILITAVAAQIWLGTLLLYDTPDGPIAHFRASENVITPK
jgi:uncharacterized membrane protein